MAAPRPEIRTATDAAASLDEDRRRRALIVLAWVGVGVESLLVAWLAARGDWRGAGLALCGVLANVGVLAWLRRRDPTPIAFALFLIGVSLTLGRTMLTGDVGPGPYFLVLQLLLAAATLPSAWLPWLSGSTVLGQVLVWRVIPHVDATLDSDQVLATSTALLVLGAAISLMQGRGWERLTTELTRRDRDARVADERHRLLADASCDLVALLDVDTARLLYASPSHQRLLGVLPIELERRGLEALVHPEDQVHAKDLLQRALDEGVARGSVRLRASDGAARTMDLVATRVDVDGKTCVATASRDVTEQRALAAQLEKSQRMESVGRLAAGLAHDFNNLLTVIRANAEFCMGALPTAHPVRSDLASIADATERGTALTRQLLALTRRSAATAEGADVTEVVESLAALLPRLLGASIRLEVNVAAGLERVVGSPAQVEQILLNLAINARDAMPMGGRLMLRAGAADTAGAVVFEVEDEGSGMSPQTLARLFEPFFTTKPEGKGTGLGLATSHAIVTQLGGHISVESELERGTVFSVTLPVAPSQAHRSGQTDGVAATVLVVDDDDAVRVVIARALRGRGHHVEQAANGNEALAHLARGAVDVAVVDLVLGPEDGLEVLERLEAVQPGLAAVLISGFSRDSEALRRRMDSGVPFVAKPFVPRDLATAVARAASTRGARRPGSGS